ncbi:hypothetical protein [Mycobacterium sp.]|uniref:hypothetical protein n=1 Tax=Mycobacterium sp. TaxID=1785 RepID=UPI003F9D504C
MDLPWSMWAMMQKFRICAGAVKVLSAKLLMGISWTGVLERRFADVQRIQAGRRGHNSPRSAVCAHD